MRRFLPLFALCLCVGFVSGAHAKDMELTVYGGYNLGGSIDVTSDQPVKLRTADSVSGGLGLTVYKQPTFNIELAWNWRPTSIETQKTRDFPDTSSGMHDDPGLNMHEFHANFMFHPQKTYLAVTPYFLVGLGMTFVVPGPVGEFEPSTATKFSWALGGGLKKYFNDRIGMRGQIRYHSTYVSDEAGGVWCDYYYGCYQTVNTNWLDEWDFQLGLIVQL